MKPRYIGTAQRVRVHCRRSLPDEVKVKHDESFMRPEATYTLKKGQEVNPATDAASANLTKEVK